MPPNVGFHPAALSALGGPRELTAKPPSSWGRKVGLAPWQLRAHDRLREQTAGQSAAWLAQPLRQLGQLLDDARLDAQPVELLDDRRLLFHPRSSRACMTGSDVDSPRRRWARQPRLLRTAGAHSSGLP